MTLLEKIKTRRAVVSVIGLGYVGLPLAVTFAEAGFSVIGIEADEAKVDSVNKGASYIRDVTSERLSLLMPSRSITGSKPTINGRAVGGGRLVATTDYDALAEADVAIICVPTPLGKTKEPDVSYIVSAADDIAIRLHDGMLVILESTTYPGATEELVLPRLQNAQGCNYEVGKDFYLVFSPERVDPGRTDWTISNTPKVIGGVTPRCHDMGKAIYESIVDEVVPVSSPTAAEMVKLLENTFRATNIGLVNEIAIMCDRLNINVWEVIEAAGTKPFGFMPFYPGPGLGGHCIPVDPHYLAWKLRTLNYNARFIQLAEEINFGMPAYVLGRIVDALNEDGKSVKGSKILVLGVTYKADIDDLRESPALDVIELLQEKGADVRYHDPYVPRLDIDGLHMTGATLDAQALRDSDCVIITTAHQSYDWGWIVEHSRLVVDTRNATEGVIDGADRVAKL